MRYLIFALALLLAACNPKESIDSVPDSKAVAEKFFSAFKAGHYEEIFALYSEDFWSTIPEETWAKILPNIREELGALETCELVNWNQRTQASTDGTGNYVVLQYSCEHEKYGSTMTFTTVKPLSGGETKIISQNFNSIGFLIE